MEFFAHPEKSHSIENLQKHLTIESLPSYCASINTVLDNQGDKGKIKCLWGEFTISRELVNGGVRFSLTNCPNCLSWTITAGHEASPQETVIHVTINRQHHEFDFIDSIHTFISDWKQGLEQAF